MKKFFAFIGILFMIGWAAAFADTLVLPASLTVIEEEAFMGDTSLDEVVLPEGITRIGENAFAGSTLSSINLPASLESIADGALPAPGSVTVTAKAGTWAFDWAVEKGNISISSLDDFIIVGGKVTGYTGTASVVVVPREDLEGNPVTIIEGYVFANHPEIVKVELPSTVEELEDYAFTNCENLATINIPAGLKKSGTNAGAFYYCNSLTDVTIEEGIKTIPSLLFKYSGVREIHLPESVKNIDYSAFEGCTSLERVEFPVGLENIGVSCFSGCIALKKVDLPEGLHNLGGIMTKAGWQSSGWGTPGEVFKDCTSLEEVTLPRDLDIAEDAFYGCSALKTVYFAEGTTTIPASLFRNSGLEEISLPATTVTVKEFAFDQCENLIEIHLNEGLLKIEHGAFRECTALEVIVLPSTVEELEDYAFTNCENLTTINIPAGLKKSGTNAGAFYYCNSLTDVTIEEGIETIPSLLFKYSGVREIHLPESVKNIDYSAFEGCTSLERVEFPVGLENIGVSCFSGCIALKKVDLPEGLHNLGGIMTKAGWQSSGWGTPGEVFKDCTSIEEVTLPRDPEVYYYAFSNCPALNKIILVYPSDMSLYTMLGLGGNSNSYTYTSSNPGIANMYTDGTITTHGIGSTTVTISRDGSTVAEYTVYVKDGRFNSGSQIVSGILREGDGWKIRWQISYDGAGGNKYNAQLYIYVEGGNSSEGCLTLHSLLDNGVLMPWLTGEYGFSRTSFNRITISGGSENTLEIIGDMFSGYTNVTRVELKKVKNIHSGAFENCTSLSMLKYDSVLTSIGDEAFKNCGLLNTLVNSSYINNVGTIGDEAFMNTALTSGALLDGASSVGDRAFANTNVGVITLKRTISMGEGVFDGCANLLIYCYYDSAMYQYAVDNNYPFRILVSAKYEQWGKKAGTIRPVEYAILNKLCTDASNCSTTGEMETNMYELLRDNEYAKAAFPLGHPLHVDQNPDLSAINEGQVQAFIRGSSRDLQIIEIKLDAKNMILIFAGTKEGQLGDILQDIGIFLDAYPGRLFLPKLNLLYALKDTYDLFNQTQIEAGRQLLNELSNFGYNTYLTGYSLGGHIAVDAALNCRELTECVTFDPPGRGDAIFANNSQNASKIRNYINMGSSVSWVGSHVGSVVEVVVEDNPLLGVIHNHDIEKTIDALWD